MALKSVNGFTETLHAIRTNKGVTHEYCMSPTIFNIYVDDALINWKSIFKQDIKVDDITLNILL